MRSCPTASQHGIIAALLAGCARGQAPLPHHRLPPSSPFLSTSLPQPFLFSFSACCFRVSRGMLIHGPLINREHRQLEAGQSRHRPSAGAVSHFACIIFNFGLRACSASRGRTGAYLVSFCCSPRSTGAWGSSLFSLERIMHEPIG